MNDFERPEENAEIARRVEAREAFMDALPQAEQMARLKGTFFTAWDDIWGWERVAITDDMTFYHAICRTQAQGNRLYSVSQTVSNGESASSDTSSTNTNQQQPVRFDMFQNSYAKKAHLFSNAPLCHKAHGHLAQAATGKHVETPEMRLNIMNGLKQHRFNKMYLAQQAWYYERDPALIIIPILEIRDVLNWNGKDAYNVMAVTLGNSKGQDCCANVLAFSPSTCNQGDIEKATNLLAVFYKGVACSVRNHEVGESFEPDELDVYSTPMTDVKRWWKMKTEFLEGEGVTIRIPRLKEDLDWNEVKVARAEASIENSLPDPFNVAVKAAINFSWIVGAKVMPTCPEYNSHSSMEDESINSSQEKWDEDDDNQGHQHSRNLDLSSLLRPVEE